MQGNYRTNEEALFFEFLGYVEFYFSRPEVLIEAVVWLGQKTVRLTTM